MEVLVCGRFKLEANEEAVAEYFKVPCPHSFIPRYNIAPTQVVPVVRQIPEGTAIEIQFLQWGLVPSWAKDLPIGARMINTRAETVADKPALRHALQHRRCLVPADGFYEWRKDGPRKQPYLIRLSGGGLFVFAGLWETWRSPEDNIVETFTILTATPNTLVAQVHDRMPVILDRDGQAAWLAPGVVNVDELLSLLVPFPADEMVAYPVSTLVNNPAVDDARCAVPERA